MFVIVSKTLKNRVIMRRICSWVQKKNFSWFILVLSRDYHILFPVLSRLSVNLNVHGGKSELIPNVATFVCKLKCTWRKI